MSILYIRKNQIYSAHDCDAYFIEFFFRRILFSVKSFFLDLFRFQALNAIEV